MRLSFKICAWESPVAASELPVELIARHGLSRAPQRGGEHEVRFLYRDRRPRLPSARRATADGALGKRIGPKPVAAPHRLDLASTIEEGTWSGLNPVPVDIAAMLGLERGVWFRIRQGIRGTTGSG